MSFIIKTAITIMLIFEIHVSSANAETFEVKRPPSIYELETLVSKVRAMFENHEVNPQLLQKLYHDYNPNVENLNLFVETAEELFPSLNCGLATVYLKEVLNSGKIINGKYEDKNHTFLLLENIDDKVIIIDITADQYGGPSIYIGPLQPPWGLNVHR